MPVPKSISLAQIKSPVPVLGLPEGLETKVGTIYTPLDFRALLMILDNGFLWLPFVQPPTDLFFLHPSLLPIVRDTPSFKKDSKFSWQPWAGREALLLSHPASHVTGTLGVRMSTPVEGCVTLGCESSAEKTHTAAKGNKSLWCSQSIRSTADQWL